MTEKDSKKSDEKTKSEPWGSKDAELRDSRALSKGEEKKKRTTSNE